VNPEEIIKEINDKWGEYIEMAEDPSAITCRILAHLLIKERQETEYLRKKLKNYGRII
jgi:hypothetical protein